MEKPKWKDIILPLVIFTLILGVTLMVSTIAFQDTKNELTYCFCCDNSPCTHTYYDFEAKECVISSGFFINVRYTPTNKSFCGLNAAELV